MEGEEFGWNEERKDTKGREERITEDGRREPLRGEERQCVRRSRKRVERRADWGLLPVEVESLWTAACFPSP